MNPLERLEQRNSRDSQVDEGLIVAFFKYARTQLSWLDRRPVSSVEITYLTSLQVFCSRDDNQSQSNFVPETSDWVNRQKIKSALQVLTFRERHLLIQFWAPLTIDGHRFLSVADQPFGLPVWEDTGFCSYRMISLGYKFSVDGETEEDLGPPGRVFRNKLPEWTPNVQYYSSKDQPLISHAVRCNVRGYLVLPVFESSGQCCVGVLELLTTAEHLDYAYEVTEICRALKDVGLKSSKLFDQPNTQIGDEGHQRMLGEIFNVLEVVCEVQKLPLAQTWVLSEPCSVVAYDGRLERSCASFDVSCVGQVCMSTTNLPFYVLDPHMWSFRKACTESHLGKGQGVVGRALSSSSMCFCRDVTQFSGTEYSLVYYARMYGLSSCFAIFLQSTYTGGDDYVIEFFLPPSITNIRDQQKSLDLLLVTLKQHIRSFKVASGKELERELSFQVTCGSMVEELENTWPQALLSGGKMEQLDLSDQQGEISSQVFFGSMGEELECFQVSQTMTSPPIPQALLSGGEMEQLDTSYHQGELSFQVICGSKDEELGCFQVSQTATSPPRPQALLTVREMEQLHPSDQQLIMGVHGINSRRAGQCNTTVTCSRKKRPIKTLETEHRKKTKTPITCEILKDYFGMKLNEVARSLHVSRSTLKHLCRQHGILKWPSWKSDKVNHFHSLSKLKCVDESVQGAELALGQTSLVRNALSGTVGLTPSPASLNQFNLCNLKVVQGEEVSLSAAFSVPDAIVSTQPEASHGGRLIENAEHSKKLVHLHPSVPEKWIPGTSCADSPCFDLPAMQAVANNAKTVPHNTALQDVRTMTIKVEYRDDIVKFQFSHSSGLVDLQEQVAKRFQLEVGSFKMKCLDEEDDWVLIACDMDLWYFMGALKSSGMTSLKVLVQPITDLPP